MCCWQLGTSSLATGSSSGCRWCAVADEHEGVQIGDGLVAGAVLVIILVTF
jgi:hypothetical protein